MDEIVGFFFDLRRSRRRAARAAIVAPGIVRIRLEADEARESSEACTADEGTSAEAEASRWERPLAEVEISDRIGDVPRRLVLAGIGTFETPDNDGIDRALAAIGRPISAVHWLEQRWPVALASLLAIAVGSLLFVRYGLPATAELAARHLPTRIDRMLGVQTLGALDRIFFETSELPEARRQTLQAHFASMTRDLRDDDGTEGGHDYRLLHRAAPALGPNALALPSGIIVMTDKLVELAHDDEELIAVLAHELGHVRGRHALRQMLQSAGISALAFVLLGDVTTASSLLSAAPVLIEAKHSRDFEREADAFAKAWLVEHGIDPSRFDDILCRMLAEAGGDDSSGLARYLSTHPPTDERVRCESP